MELKPEQKKERLLAVLDRGMAMIHLDARRPGVLVPTHLKSDPHLLLNLSSRFDPPDLSVGEWGVRATLTFAGKRFTVAVPWSALYAITSHVTQEFFVFPDDFPPELVAQTQVTDKVPLESIRPAQPELAPPLRPRAVLREVPAVADDAPVVPEIELAAVAPVATETDAPPQTAAAPQESNEPPPPKPVQRGHLRLVK
jgi:stringent starvation protein B